MSFLTIRANAGARPAVDDQLLAVGVPPDRRLEGFQLVPGEVLLGPLPDQRRLGDMGITVEGREILGHGCKSLHRHGVPPCVYTSSSQPGGTVTAPWRAKMASMLAM